MSRSLDIPLLASWPASHWAKGGLALALAIGTGLLLAQLLMAPPAGDMRSLAAYLTLSGVATVAAGWAVLRLADRSLGLSIQAKALLSSLIGSGVALLNVFIVAQLMFVSTGHDLKLLVALLVFSGVITFFFSLWVASTAAGRIGVVARGIKSLAAGQYRARVAVEGSDEVAELAETVNVLAERLGAAEEQRASLDRERRELTAAISHDLRTPLASVRAMVEALDDRVVEDPSEVDRYYTAIRREIERLARMIDDMFVLAQVDARALRLERRPVALQEVAAEVVDAMRAQAERRRVDLRLQLTDDPPELLLDGGRMERAVTNLVRNALEHSGDGGEITVRVHQQNGWVGLSVSDTGDGIAGEDLPHIWKRFYRAEKSRGRGPDSADGAGLGLTIVRGIVEAHGGTVDVRSERGAGSVFTILLPRTQVE